MKLVFNEKAPLLNLNQLNKKELGSIFRNHITYTHVSGIQDIISQIIYFQTMNTNRIIKIHIVCGI